MNPMKLGKLDNHDQEPWKVPLPQFIERLYVRNFGRARPEVVMSVEERARAQQAKKAAGKEARRLAPKHVPAKWTPVRRQEHAQRKSLQPFPAEAVIRCDSIRPETAVVKEDDRSPGGEP